MRAYLPEPIGYDYDSDDRDHKNPIETACVVADKFYPELLSVGKRARIDRLIDQFGVFLRYGFPCNRLKLNSCGWRNSKCTRRGFFRSEYTYVMASDLLK